MSKFRGIVMDLTRFTVEAAFALCIVVAGYLIGSALLEVWQWLCSPSFVSG